MDKLADVEPSCFIGCYEISRISGLVDGNKLRNIWRIMNASHMTTERRLVVPACLRKMTTLIPLGLSHNCIFEGDMWIHCDRLLATAYEPNECLH